MATHSSRLIIALVIAAFLITPPFNSMGQGLVDASPEVASIDRVDEAMRLDPAFHSTAQEVLVSSAPIELWMRALDREEPALSRVTVDTIALACRRGMPGIEVVGERLKAMLSEPGLEAETRRAVAKALVDLDDPDSAEVLAEAARNHGPVIAVVVEPALIRWGSQAMADEWLERISGPSDNIQLLVLAIRGVGTLKLMPAGDPLLGLIKSTRAPLSVRIAASQALGRLYPSGLAPLAKALIAASPESIRNDLMAAHLLSNHRDDQTVVVLRELVGRESTVVQSAALNRLYQIDPSMLLEYLPGPDGESESSVSLLKSPDINVRSRLADAMVSVRTEAVVAPLATLLNDVNPTLRRRVADSLVDFAESAELRDSVISQASGVLDQDDWRGCEQAAIVLVNLEHNDCSDRLVDLLRHPRGEVMVTAAWGLRRFALPQHLPAMLGRAEEVFGEFKKNKLTEDSPGYVDMMAQLFMTFGLMDYKEAEPLAMSYLPRNFTYGEKARAAAVWMLGLLHEGEPDEKLAKQMVTRLHDIDSNFPEYEEVRLMCVVSLTRMNAKSAAEDLRRYASESGGVLSQACNWGLELLTGETPLTPRIGLPLKYNDWFLRPLNDAGASE